MYKIVVIKTLEFVLFDLHKRRRKTFSSLASVLFVLIFLSACTPNADLTFQRMQPESTVKLSELLSEVPVLKKMFANIDPLEFDSRLADFLDYDAETSVFMLNQLHHLIRVNNDLPKLIDDLSGILKLALDYYQDENNRAEFEKIGVAFDRFSQSEFIAFFQTSRSMMSTLSRATYYISKNTHFFPDANAINNSFAPLEIWSNCSIPNKYFQDEKPEGLENSKNVKSSMLFMNYLE